FRPNVEALHLTGPLVDLAEADAPVAGEQHQLVEAERVGDLGVEVLKGEVDAERIGVLPQEHSHDVGVARAGLPDRLAQAPPSSPSAGPPRLMRSIHSAKSGSPTTCLPSTVSISARALSRGSALRTMSLVRSSLCRTSALYGEPPPAITARKVFCCEPS